MVVNRSSNCGDGTQTRDANCYSLKGQLVSDQRYGKGLLGNIKIPNVFHHPGYA